MLLLTELDYGMARSGNRHVAREMAERLGMAYAFAPCYVNLSKGSGLESGAEGENAQALHGNAVLSRWPVRRAWSVALPNGKDKLRGREKGWGAQRAVVCEASNRGGVSAPSASTSTRIRASATGTGRCRSCCALPRSH